MPVSYPTPVDDTYDYVPIRPRGIRVGTDLLALALSAGKVESATLLQSGTWMYQLMYTPRGGGDPVRGVAMFPPPTAGADWFTDTALWKRTAKPSNGAIFPGPDGSRWIYPAGEDGRVLCFAAGSLFTVGARMFRGEVLTDPGGIWPLDDDDQWDWLPVTAGTDVVAGDVVTFRYSVTGPVTDIVVEDHQPSHTRYTPRHTWMENGNETWEALGWWDELGPAPDPWLRGFIFDWSWFQRLPKPAADAKFAAPDQSRWIYIGASKYYCWVAGTIYPQGSIFRRGEITGGLTRI